VAPATADAGTASRIYLYASTRCADCHDKMFGEWQKSAHARSASSRVFAAMRTTARDDNCYVCHQPLANYAAPPSAAKEGVTCDVCHTLRSVKNIEPFDSDGFALDEPGPKFGLSVQDPIRYGPYCELEDHYFHRMGCSPLHRKSELCAACHQSRWDGRGIYTTYREWQGTRYARRGVQCQDCHGPVQTMKVVYQYPSLKMGWCITCHRQHMNDAQNPTTTDCVVCHH